MTTSNQSFIRLSVVAGMMLLAAFTRLIPHPANLTAVMAIALFGGAKFKNSSLAVIIPIMVMLITDVVIGFYSLMPVVYACIAVTALLGVYIGKKSNPMFVIGASLFSSVLFFIATNAAVWYHDPLYVQNASGLMLCYEAAIPFFKNQLIGDLFFNCALFGGFKLVTLRYPALSVAS